MTESRRMLQQRRLSTTPSLHKVSMTDGVLKFGYTSVIFVDPRVNVDETYYCDLLLSQQLLPAVRQVSGAFIFQQDSAPVCKARQFSDRNISQGSVATQ